jgi:hypothetical protein
MIIELFILFEMIDAGVNDDPKDPAFQRAAIFILVNLTENLDEALLKHILRILPCLCITITYGKHLGTEPMVQFLLRRGIMSKAPLKKHLFCHENKIVLENKTFF